MENLKNTNKTTDYTDSHRLSTDQYTFGSVESLWPSVVNLKITKKTTDYTDSHRLSTDQYTFGSV
ncbi:MAG: hypothetical protein ACPLXM_13725, partial [Bacteroidales bacterium]